MLKGLNYEEFLEALLRIAVKGSSLLNSADAEFKDENVTDKAFKDFL